MELKAALDVYADSGAIKTISFAEWIKQEHISIEEFTGGRK